jgi:hypothetical protein
MTLSSEPQACAQKRERREPRHTRGSGCMRSAGALMRSGGARVLRRARASLRACLAADVHQRARRRCRSGGARLHADWRRCTASASVGTASAAAAPARRLCEPVLHASAHARKRAAESAKRAPAMRRRRESPRLSVLLRGRAARARLSRARWAVSPLRSRRARRPREGGVREASAGSSAWGPRQREAPPGRDASARDTRRHAAWPPSRRIRPVTASLRASHTRRTRVRDGCDAPSAPPGAPLPRGHTRRPSRTFAPRARRTRILSCHEAASAARLRSSGAAQCSSAAAASVASSCCPLN